MIAFIPILDYVKDISLLTQGLSVKHRVGNFASITCIQLSDSLTWKAHIDGAS